MIKNHTLIVVAAVCMYALTTSVSAQTDSSYHPISGAWALQFQIAPQLFITDFQGSLLSVKKQFGTDFAVRGGINLGGNNLTYSRESLTEEGNSGYRTSSLETDIRLQLLYYVAHTNAIHVFAGMGPILSFYRNKYSTSTSDNSSEERTVSDNNIGINVFGGVEWFIQKRVSLTAEYAASWLHSEHKSVTNNTGPPDGYNSSRSSELFNTDPVRVGISLYF